MSDWILEGRLYGQVEKAIWVSDRYVTSLLDFGILIFRFFQLGAKRLAPRSPGSIITLSKWEKMSIIPILVSRSRVLR